MLVSFSGNTISCMTAVATIVVIKEEKLFENASKLGVYLKRRLEELSVRYDSIGDVSEICFMFNVELVKDRKTKIPVTGEAKSIQEYAYRKGLIIGRVGRYCYGN